MSVHDDKRRRQRSHSFKSEANIPLSLYIHLPWCVKKCPYCDFNSHASTSEVPEAAYIAALLQDLEHDLPLVWGRRISSIFFGGGTPSLFSADGINTILEGVRARIPVLPTAEITLEANPGTVEQNKFLGFKAAGVNRLSIGVQSFQEKYLKSLGRIHDGDEARRAIDAAKMAGFTNINIDLMFALPSQTVEDALKDLEIAVQFKTQHLSWYHLTLEPNTLFFAKPPTLPSEEIQNDISIAGKNFLINQGYCQYEVSAYSQPHYPCAHNMNYWQFGDYLGIGAGAHSKITQQGDFLVSRFSKLRHPKAYLAAENKLSTQKVLTENDLILEFMMNALRLLEGVPVALFEERTGVSLGKVLKMLENTKKQGLLEDFTQVLKATSLGQQFLDTLVGSFMS